jgi:predicted GNAT family N-acyltransferase
MSEIKVKSASWDKDRVSLKEIRRQVFVIEQGVDERLEWDNDDANSEHFIAYINGDAVGCARLVGNKKIGRMAVLKAFRANGVGSKILDHIKRHSSQKRYTRLVLSAQCHAYEFYRSNGFEAFSVPYEDANIPHIDMEHRVFSQDESEDSQYYMKSDQQIHHGDSIIQAEGYLDIALSQVSRSVILCINDIQHPLCSNKNLLNRLKIMARTNKHFKCYILITNYQPKFNDTALFRLADRLPSFIKIKASSEPVTSHWVFDSNTWLDFKGNESRVCYSDRSKIKHFMERFNKWWTYGKQITDTKRLSI